MEDKVKLGIANKFVITFVGRYVEFKGFDIVIKVFRNISKKIPNKFALLLVGGIDPIHSTGMSQTECFFNEEGIVNIGFTSNIDKYLSLTDLFFFPSKKEGLPICVIESLSMGVPVLSFTERGIVDLIDNYFNGIMIESSNKEIDILRFSEIILDLMSNNLLLKQISLNALSRRHTYSRAIFVEEQLNFYLNTLSIVK